MKWRLKEDGEKRRENISEKYNHGRANFDVFKKYFENTNCHIIKASKMYMKNVFWRCIRKVFADMHKNSQKW